MINWIAAFVVLLVALKHMEEVKPCATGLPWRQRLRECGLGVAWIIVGLYSFWRVIRPIMATAPSPTLLDTLSIVVMAIALLGREVWVIHRDSARSPLTWGFWPRLVQNYSLGREVAALSAFEALRRAWQYTRIGV
jgi:hypothetical protein